MKSLLLIAPLLLAACSPTPEVHRDAAGNEISAPFVVVEGQATPTDVALFLAGRPVVRGSRLSRIQQTGEYRAFSRDSLNKWKLRTSKRVTQQNIWQAQYIYPLVGKPKTLVYPFGGPDLLYALAMFPDATRYVLLGLEPAGGLPDLEGADPGAVIASLDRHALSVNTQLLHGYFITKDMKTDFSNGPLQGVTPILLTSLGLMHARIDGIQNTTAGGNPAVQIDFTLPGTGRKSVTYVSGDLSNGGFKGSYESWLSSVGSGSVAYFKAASYLMQDSGFSAAKNWVLGNCRAIVQDDSGIPYKTFDQTQWDIHLFGRYTAPIEFFARHSQPDLRAAYEAAGPLPGITFGSGYQMKADYANLMIAIRR
jgi:hypothetical protein